MRHTYCVTFGDRERREVHPTFAAAHPDGWVRMVEANDRGDAMRAARQAFGERWAQLQEPHELEPRYYPRGELAVLNARTGELREP